MTTSLDQLRAWMERPREDEHLEFKEAKHSYDNEKLVSYCIALANERGGKFILGVTNAPPRRVVGSSAFSNLEKVKHELFDRLRMRIDLDEVIHPDGRVLVFHVPARPIGTPLHLNGAYLMRSGESLVPMSPDQLRRIFDEAEPDHSATRCPGATLSELDPRAIEEFRTRWLRKSGNAALQHLSPEQLLADAGLLVEGVATYAALVLLGSKAGLARHLAAAEVIFEYRSSDASIPFQQRKEYREPFLLFADDLWNTINLRNEVQHFQDGLFVLDVPTFNERVVREALLNAVSHRDYRLPGSVFVRQWPRLVEIVSPGGFPPGITPDNILWKQAPRNRLLADALARCGLVERSGQGADLMFVESIRQGKQEPDFSRSDPHEVCLRLNGEVSEPLFLRFLEEVSRSQKRAFSTLDLLVLERIARELPLLPALHDRLPALLEEGVIEKVGRRYILSQRFHRFLGRKGAYTRKRGLASETQKALILQHIETNKAEGSQFKEFQEVFPNLSRDQLQGRLRELKREGKAHSRGVTKNARWFPGPAPEAGASDAPEIASDPPKRPQS
jgi:ATP-dependent DNA helicase RecG